MKWLRIFLLSALSAGFVSAAEIRLLDGTVANGSMVQYRKDGITLIGGRETESTSHLWIHVSPVGLDEREREMQRQYVDRCLQAAESMRESDPDKAKIIDEGLHPILVALGMKEEVATPVAVPAAIGPPVEPEEPRSKSALRPATIDSPVEREKPRSNSASPQRSPLDNMFRKLRPYILAFEPNFLHLAILSLVAYLGIAIAAVAGSFSRKRRMAFQNDPLIARAEQSTGMMAGFYVAGATLVAWYFAPGRASSPELVPFGAILFTAIGFTLLSLGLRAGSRVCAILLVVWYMVEVTILTLDTSSKGRSTISFGITTLVTIFFIRAMSATFLSRTRRPETMEPLPV